MWCVRQSGVLYRTPLHGFGRTGLLNSKKIGTAMGGKNLLDNAELLEGGIGNFRH